MLAISIYYDSEAPMSKAYNIFTMSNPKIIACNMSTKRLTVDGIITVVFARSNISLEDPFAKRLLRDLVRTSSSEIGQKPLIPTSSGPNLLEKLFNVCFNG